MQSQGKILKRRPKLSMNHSSELFPFQPKYPSSLQPKFNSSFQHQTDMLKLPLKTYGFNDNIKVENNHQLHNIIQKRKNEKSQNSNSLDYDLFEIEKKRKKQKYKRSTNNSHKKFISALKRLFYSVISTKQKDQFEFKYSKYRSCRTFFFIILAYMKRRFSGKLLNSVRISFINQMKIKIHEYQEEISRTKNMNLKNFREEQIIDIKYSIKSCNQYMNGDSREAIQSMYKKDKATVTKRQHYESALKSIRLIEKELDENPKIPLQSPYIEDFSNSSDRQRIQRKVIKREIRFDQMKSRVNHLSDGGKKGEVQITRLPQLNYDAIEPSHQFAVEREILFPPLLEAIPFVPYNPFNPPFRYKRETKYQIDVREDFFGPFNFGQPKFYEKIENFSKMRPQFVFEEKFTSRI